MKRQLQYQDDVEGFERASHVAAFRDDSPSLTHQGPAAECDINMIAKAYGLTAGSKMPVPAEALDPRFYGDLSQAPESLQDALELVRDAEAKFQRLPADVRAMFNHAPGVMWDWLQDPANGPEAVKLGLLVDLKPVTPPSSSEGVSGGDGVGAA